MSTTLVDFMVSQVPKITEYVSATRLTTWMRCPLAFRLRYLEGMEPMTTPSLFVGKCAHQVLAHIYKEIMSGEDIAASDITDIVQKIWPQMLEIEPCFFDDEEHEDKCRNQVIDLTSAYICDVDVRNEKVIAVERKFENIILEYGSNEIFRLPLVGVIDLIIKTPEGYVIVDFKTAASASFCTLSHEVQLAAYAYLTREVFGQSEARLEIRQLIKTKTPKIVIQRYQTRDAYQMQRFFNLVREYHHALEEGTFNYRPSWNCSMCEHIEVCQTL